MTLSMLNNSQAKFKQVLPNMNGVNQSRDFSRKASEPTNMKGNQMIDSLLKLKKAEKDLATLD